MKRDDIIVLAGEESVSFVPWRPFHSLACEFLDDLSRELLHCKEAKQYPDVITFAFWCRKGNIQNLKGKYDDLEKRLGRGMTFHIAPSNVPVNFAFSYVFGLLSGNANVVRVSSKNHPQIQLICEACGQLFKKEKYQGIKGRTSIISYERNKEITDYYSASCQARVIWGGDDTIREIRKSETGTRCVDILFSDRYSLAVLDAKTILESSSEELKALAEAFYNDTYLMDQNACSSPSFILWRGKEEAVSEAGKRFWTELSKKAGSYELAEIKVSEKYRMLSKNLMCQNGIKEVKKYENFLYVVSMNHLPEDVTAFKGKFGLFYEYGLENLEEIGGIITEKIQTLAYYGVEKQYLTELVCDHCMRGIDRIVPVGKALDIGLMWDGYDIIRYLSRIVI